MKIDPFVTGFRKFNILLLLVSSLLALVAARKILSGPGIVPVLALILGLIAAIHTWHHLRTRRGAVLLGCSRRYLTNVHSALLRDKPLGAVYRTGRGLGYFRELFAHHRHQGIDDKALILQLRQYIDSTPQHLNARETTLFVLWGVALLMAVLVFLWLLIA